MKKYLYFYLMKHLNNLLFSAPYKEIPPLFPYYFLFFCAKRFVLSSRKFLSQVYALVVWGMTGRFLKGGLLACERAPFTR